MTFIFTIGEMIDLLVMTFLVGFLFKDHFSARVLFNKPYKIHADLTKTQSDIFWKDMFTAILIVAPAIILHELGHKFVAMAFGFQSEFHAAYFWLVIALILKMMNFGFVFLVPAYVSSACIGVGSFCIGKSYYLASGLIAIAGPFVNFILWIVSFLIIKNSWLPKKYKRWEPVFVVMARINFFLMLFNMIPIAPFDGYHFFNGLFNFFF